MLRSSTLRVSSAASAALSSTSLCRASRIAPTFQTITHRHQQPVRQAHAISNPTLANIEKRWEDMPPQEQAELWMQLRDRMKVDWHEMTLQEKKAAYWIAFGPHGPRALTPPGEGWRVFGAVSALVGVSLLLFAFTRYFAREPPRTMTKEWQEQTNEYLKSQNVEPITGVSSEGYKGPGMVQSK